MFFLICSVDLWLYHGAATYRILGRCSTRIQSAHHRFCQSFCNFEKIWSILIFAPMLRWHLDSDGSSQDTFLNLKRRSLVCRRLMILSSSVNDRYFHDCFSQPIVSKPEISSCSVTNFADMLNICFSVRSSVFTMELWFWKLFPMNTADSIVTAINIHQIIECSSPSPATLEILLCLFRTWSFTRFTNDLDSTDNSNSVSSFPKTKFWGLATSWEMILSGRPDLSRSVLRSLRIARFRR